jgi:hypothetical protein
MTEQDSRTRWAEKQAEEILSAPFISEFVLRSPQMLDGTQKEIADLLILFKGTGILVSQKAQEDPLSHDDRKNELWALKAAKSGVRQLLGALRSSTRPFWCEHPRRGRVDYPTGLPSTAHGIVMVETFRPVDLQSAAADLPLSHGNVPVTYISINDLLNVATQLRTLPELLRYLEARRELPERALRRIGEEQPILEFYLLYETLRHCSGHELAKRATAVESDRVDEILLRMDEYKHFSSLMEHVGHELAMRSASSLEGLSPELTAMYDASERRQNYVLMQELIADLPLRERAELGRQFDAVSRRVEGESGYAQAAAQLDSRADWVFVFGASRGWERPGMLHCMPPTMRAALTHNGKQKCMMVIDREGAGYEVGMLWAQPSFIPAIADVLNGQKLFGNLRVAAIPVEEF